MTPERQLEELIGREIPLARAMGLTVERLGGEEVVLGAPLAPNANDKGCAFAGSLASLLTLAGWALVREALGAPSGLAIYVADSRIRYLAPVFEALRVRARLAQGADARAARAALAEGGRARLPVLGEVLLADGRTAALFEARFVALPAGAGGDA